MGIGDFVRCVHAAISDLMRQPSFDMAEFDSNDSRYEGLQDFPDAISAHGYKEGLDYTDGQEMVILHHNLYHMTLESKLRVFVFLFTIIIVPATIVFVVCYVRDRRKQKQNKEKIAALKQDTRSQSSLPYSARLSRPVPVSVSEFPSEVDQHPNGEEEGFRKISKVSFASNVIDNDGRRSTLSSASRRHGYLPDALVEIEDDVFAEIDANNTNSPTSQQAHQQTTLCVNNTKMAAMAFGHDTNIDSNHRNHQTDILCPGTIPLSDRGSV